jgi:hypothetical protein
MQVHRNLRGSTVACALALLLLAIPASAQGVTVTESGDAGSLPASAQTSTGVPTLITGALQSPGDEDVYRICLSGGGSFSASTVGSALFDPQLFLFDASGRGVYANDDFVGLQSTLPAGHPLTPTAAGTYYLAITSFNNDPLSSGGPIFGFDFPIQAPDGPGGGSPVSGWTDQGFDTGAYRITLTGTQACLPATKQECKNGGWRDFGDTFKNQGDCVSFVATKGKNPPAGPPSGGAQ